MLLAGSISGDPAHEAFRYPDVILIAAFLPIGG
jgi:hypothetical protein